MRKISITDREALKELGTELGLDFPNNVPTSKLVELIKAEITEKGITDIELIEEGVIAMEEGGDGEEVEPEPPVLQQVTLVLKNKIVEFGTVLKYDDIFVSATNAKGENVTADVALNGLVLPTDIGSHDISHEYTDGELDGSPNTVTATCKITINRAVVPVTLLMKDATKKENESIALDDVFKSATNGFGDSVTADEALKGLDIPKSVGTHVVTHTYTDGLIDGKDNSVTATANIKIEEEVFQVTLVMKDLDVVEGTQVTKEQLFTSATNRLKQPVTADIALDGIVLPTSVGVHTVEHTYTDGLINDSPNSVTASSQLTINKKIEKVTLKMKDANKKEGELTTKGDLFVSASDNEGNPVSADVALSGLVIPTTTGTHNLEHTYTDGEIDGAPNSATATAVLTIDEEALPEPDPTEWKIGLNDIDGTFFMYDGKTFRLEVSDTLLYIIKRHGIDVEEGTVLSEGGIPEKINLAVIRQLMADGEVVLFDPRTGQYITNKDLEDGSFYYDVERLGG